MWLGLSTLPHELTTWNGTGNSSKFGDPSAKPSECQATESFGLFPSYLQRRFNWQSSTSSKTSSATREARCLGPSWRSSASSEHLRVLLKSSVVWRTVSLIVDYCA